MTVGLEPQKPFACPEHSGIVARIKGVESDIAEIKGDIKSALKRVPYPLVFLLTGLGCLASGLAVAWLTKGG